MADTRQGQYAKCVSLYQAEELPVVDGIILTCSGRRQVLKTWRP